MKLFDKELRLEPDCLQPRIIESQLAVCKKLESGKLDVVLMAADGEANDVYDFIG